MLYHSLIFLKNKVCVGCVYQILNKCCQNDFLGGEGNDREWVEQKNRASLRTPVHTEWEGKVWPREGSLERLGGFGCRVLKAWGFGFIVSPGESY